MERARAVEMRATKKRCFIPWGLAWIVAGIWLLSSWCGYAQEPIPTSPPVPVGSGARAMGMGGAFIAVADDATAASWNPGGLGQLQQPEMSVVGSYFLRQEDYSGNNVENMGSSRNSSSDLNYFSLALAGNIWQRNLFCSLNYQKLFDFSRSVQCGSRTPDKEGGTINAIKNDFKQQGSLYAYSPAIAVEWIPGSLYVGLAYNLWSDNYTHQSRWESFNHGSTSGQTFSSWDTKEVYKDFHGENWTFGLLWKLNPQLQLGGVYKTPFKARVRYERFDEFPGGACTEKKILHINFPVAYGVGLSYKLGNSWTLAGDVTYTRWQDYQISDSGTVRGPFVKKSGQLPEKDPTYTARLGVEYAYILDEKDLLVLPVRLGVFYDPEPSVKAPQDFYGLSCGFGIADKRFSLDFAYQFRTGTPVNSIELGLDPAQVINKGDEGKIRQHFFLTSLIFYRF
ncbi:MAG: hypothetical protein K6U11_01840 [bacterium]|nr:hypothetical protein [bacterium]